LANVDFAWVDIIRFYYLFAHVFLLDPIAVQ
jgi:hypothetical protein